MLENTNRGFSRLNSYRAMMEKEQIHPRHHLCDMTAEIAAGAPPKEALEQMVRRTDLKETYSIYQLLFPQRLSYR